MKLRNGRLIKTGGEPYIVAELNSSHNGKVDNAKKMIDAAKACGCDAVKFQSWSAQSLYCQDYYEQNPIAERMVSRFSMKQEDLLELSEYCNRTGIDFSSTPYSEEEADFLIDVCGVPFVKISSMDISYLPYLRYVAKKDVPIVLSTGMATIEEIETAVTEMKRMGNQDICILHCVSLYPAEASLVNLNNIIMLKERFPGYAIGYSDHTKGSEAACASVGLGAALIEKHFTLDSTKIGWDNQMATEPAEMKALVEICRRAYQSLGSYERTLTSDERMQQRKMRRSIVAAVNMCAGHVIDEKDLTARRPGDGIPVSRYSEIVGRTLIHDVRAGHLILEEYLRERKGR